MSKTLLEQSYGTYRLISWKASSSDGGSYYPLGEDALGFIMYNQDGYMSAQIMAGKRENFLKEKFNSNNPSWHHTGIGYLAYSGRYKVDEENATFTHFMDVGLNPEWHGSSQPRKVRFEGNRLYIVNPLSEEDELIWERVEKHYS